MKDLVDNAHASERAFESGSLIVQAQTGVMPPRLWCVAIIGYLSAPSHHYCYLSSIYLLPSSHQFTFPMPTGNLAEIGKCLDRYQKQKLVMAPGKCIQVPSPPTYFSSQHDSIIATEGSKDILSSWCFLDDSEACFAGSMPKIVDIFIEKVKKFIHGERSSISSCVTSPGCLLLVGCSFAGAGGGGFLTIVLKDSAHRQKVKSIIDTTVVSCFLPPSLLSFFRPSSISSSHPPQFPLFILLSILFFFLSPTLQAY